ncbi:MAG TPA: molybdopterin-binding protein [Candidatus Limnocylindrales bacterium]|jgi:nicotinamide-nucleotide amidase|nr:molybdopterin-binding protein [Candidatus Limnocylindrales bacterium]
MPDDTGPGRELLHAELLSIGSELTVGETRDTNAGELARALTLEGVIVGRITALPDRLEAVRDALTAGLERADLVVSTGGLGPTPDDLTREAIAAATGETPAVDPELDAWLRDRWARRGLPFPEINLKQAWLIPSAVALPNPNGSAPGWFVSRPDGRVIVALPGPPREMRPMWSDQALPRLRTRGLGREIAVQTFRLTGIGESQVAEILGEEMLRRPDPEVATYARVEAVDIRVSADGPGSDGATAAERVAAASSVVRERLGSYVWAEGDTTWSSAIGQRLAELGWRLAVDEIGSGGQVGLVLGDDDRLALVESRPFDAARPTDDVDDEGSLIDRARGVRSRAGVEVGLAVRVRPRGSEYAVSVAVVTPRTERRQTRTTYAGGSIGRSQSGLLAAAILLETLR